MVRDHVIGFAHRGASRSPEEDNTLAAFEHALHLGASGLETDVALTADGVPVLVHQGLLQWRRIRFDRTLQADLPPHIPTLADLYRQCGTDFDLCLDMVAPTAVEKVMDLASQFGAGHRLWLTYWNIPTLARWRDRWAAVRLVYPTIPLPRRFRREVADLASAGVDAINLNHRYTRTGSVDAIHDAGLKSFSWGIKQRRQLEGVLSLGVDGVYCDNVEDMVHLLDGT